MRTIYIKRHRATFAHRQGVCSHPFLSLPFFPIQSAGAYTASLSSFVSLLRALTIYVEHVVIPTKTNHKLHKDLKRSTDDFEPFFSSQFPRFLSISEALCSNIYGDQFPHHLLCGLLYEQPCRMWTHFQTWQHTAANTPSHFDICVTTQTVKVKDGWIVT